MSGWRANAHVLDQWLSLNPHQIAFLQETHVTQDTQTSIEAEMKRKGYTCCWGKSADRSRIANGRLRVNWGACPGVAIMAPTELQPCQKKPKTEAATRWFERGRLILAQILASALPILLICLYLPAGKECEDMRNQMCHDVYHEIRAQDCHSFLLAADFNMCPLSNPLSAGLIQDGAGVPLWMSPQGEECTATYQSGTASSLLDGFVAGPDLQVGLHQTVHTQAGSAHAIVTCQVSCDTVLPYPRLQPQVLLRRRETSIPDHEQEAEWAMTHRMICDTIADQRQRFQTEPEAQKIDSRQEAIDMVWALFHARLAEVVHNRADVVNKQGSQVCGHQVGRSQLEQHVAHARQLSMSGCQGVATRMKQRHTTCAARVHAHVNRLISLAQGVASPATEERILKDATRIALVSPAQVRKDVLDPVAAIPRWQQRLRRYVRNEQDRHGRRWRRSLVNNHSITPRLYRWLKGGVPTPGFSVLTSSGPVYGAAQTFSSLRAYWQSHMQCEMGTEEALERLGFLELSAETPSCLTADLLLAEARRMNHKAAGGLDGWMPSVLPLLTRPICETLVELYQHNMRMCCWPTSAAIVRTQLIPKSVNAHAVSDQRPISILSIWYRLWSRSCLMSLGTDLIQKPNVHLRGGIPSRSIDESLLTWALQVEAAQHELSDCDPRKGQANLCLLTLDAVKCFDKISQEGVLREARSFGLPDEVVRSLAAFFRSITRVITYAGHVDIWGFHPTVGIPQGCALSAFLCNVLVSGWAYQVAVHATPEAYLDDRTMYARTPGELHAAWVSSQVWDLQHGWTLNHAKTALAMTHPDEEVQFTFDDGQPLAKQDCILTLGHQIPFSFRHALELQVKRWKAALRSCERLEVMRVSTVAAQRVIATVVMRQFAFGFQAIPIPVRQCKSLRAAVKRAAHVAGRRHSWAALSALILKPDQMDPQAVAIYEHLTTVLRALRKGQLAWKWWIHIGTLPEKLKPRGPRGVTSFYLRKLGVDESEGGHVWSDGIDTIRVLEDPWPLAKHSLRQWLRRWLLRVAEATHQNLEGAAQSDIKVSVRLLRSAPERRQNLCVLLADGLWTFELQARIGWIDSPTCPFCGAASESVRHVIHVCSEWQEHRQALKRHAIWLSSQSLATQACLLCPMVLPRI